MFALPCNKCKKTSIDSLLDPVTNNVICSECGLIIDTVAPMMKTAMRSVGAFFKEDLGKSFLVDCKKCGKRAKPMVIDKTKFMCRHCNSELILDDKFKIAILDFVNGSKKKT